MLLRLIYSCVDIVLMVLFSVAASYLFLRWHCPYGVIFCCCVLSILALTLSLWCYFLLLRLIYSCVDIVLMVLFSVVASYLFLRWHCPYGVIFCCCVLSILALTLSLWCYFLLLRLIYSCVDIVLMVLFSVVASYLFLRWHCPYGVIFCCCVLSILALTLSLWCYFLLLAEETQFLS